MKKTLTLKRHRDHCSIGSVKKAKKNSSPVLKESLEYHHSHEESSANLVANMSEEFLDLYDDLDDWRQEDGEPKEEMIDVAASKHSDSSNGVIDDKYLIDMDLYDDLDDWRDDYWEDDMINTKPVSNSASESEHSDNNSDGVPGDKFVIDMDLYDDLDDWRDDYWEEDMINAKLVSNSSSKLSGNDGGTCERGENEDIVLSDDDDDPCEEEKADISYYSDYFDVAIAQMKERLKKKKAVIQSWQLDVLKTTL